MSGHLTKQPSSWRNWFLSKLGLTDLPTPVNCWYCNQTMYLLPGSKQTERHWHCNLCENTNVIDEFGDIMDAPPLPDSAYKYGYELAKEQQRTNKQPTSTSSGSSHSRTLCDSCQSNQTLIYQIMSDYIRDESDPDYDYYVETADSRQQQLHAKYPLCDDCQRKIQDIVAEQRILSRRRRINEQRQRSLHAKTPIRLTSNQYLMQGLFWLLLHCSVLFLCTFAVYYPPQPLSHKSVITPVKSWLLRTSDYIFALLKRNEDQHTTVLSLSSPLSLVNVNDVRYQSFFASLMNILMLIAFAFRDMICFLYHASCKLALSNGSYTDNIDQASHHFWNVTDMGITCYTLYYAFSFYFMNWHFRASRTFLGITKPPYWKTYKAIQGFLYCGRLVFLYSLGFMAFTSNTTIWKAFSCIYFLLLLSSVLFVKVKKSAKSKRLPKKFVYESDNDQKQQELQQQTDPVQNRHFVHPPSDPAAATAGITNRPSLFGPAELDENQNSPWYAAPLNLFKRQECDNDDGVDGLTSELGKISV